MPVAGLFYRRCFGLFRWFPSFAQRCERCLVYPRCFVCLALLVIVLLNSITAEQAVTSHNFKIRVYSYFPLYVNPIFINLAAALFGSRPPPFTAKTRTRQKELESSNIARAKIKVVSDIRRRILSFVSGSHLLFQMRRFYLRCFVSTPNIFQLVSSGMCQTHHMFLLGLRCEKKGRCLNVTMPVVAKTVPWPMIVCFTGPCIPSLR